MEPLSNSPERGRNTSTLNRARSVSPAPKSFIPQRAPGADAAIGHLLGNSIPLSIFPINSSKLCVCFCGLPGRGKTHIAKRLARYLSFFHAVSTEIYNVADYRRRLCGALQDAEWFDTNNSEAFALRTSCNDAALSDISNYLQSNESCVGILDGSNASHSRRSIVYETMKAIGVRVLFIEVINDNPTFLSEQYKIAASTSPDYKGIERLRAETDYRKKVEFYGLSFETMSQSHPVESKWAFFKCDHSKHHFEVHNVKGYLLLKIVHFIMNIRTTMHSFFLTRHGQSEYNLVGRIGGDSGLSEQGLTYAEKLAEFVERKITHDESGNPVAARLWTSTMCRTKETAQFIKHDEISIRDEDDESITISWIQMKHKPWFHLDEIFAGTCDGMTYEEIEQEFPDEFELRQQDKLAYRYPRGESYLDVIARLEPIIIEMERHREPLLIVGHQGILRIIYAFYTGKSRSEAPYVSIPLNTVIELIPTAYECYVERHVLYTPENIASDGQDEPSKKKLLDPPSH